MKTHLHLAAFIFLFASCSKEINTLPTNASAKDAINSNISTNTYLPLTKNTYWNYKVTTESNQPESSSLKVTGRQKIINGKNYSQVKSVTGKDTSIIYYSQVQHDYYIYTNTATTDADNVNLEILFLEDDVAVGNSWITNAGDANGFNLKCYGKIIEKNITLTISGVVYKNVIHTYVEIRKPFFFTYIVVDKQDFYTAENIGIIKNVSDILLPTNSTSTTLITDYRIK